jgi:hypothetical protein
MNIAHFASFGTFVVDSVLTGYCSKRIKIFLYVLLKDVAFSIDPEMVIQKKVK